MSASIGQVRARPEAMVLWARLEISTVAMMAIGAVLCGWPLLEASTPAALDDALAATGNAFAAFVIGELLCVPFATLIGEKRCRRLVRPAAAGLGLVCTLAGMSARSAAARTAWYTLAGLGAAAAHAWITGNAVESPLLRRGPVFLAILATCAVVLALELGLYLLAAGPQRGIGIVVACGAAQGAVIVAAGLNRVDPPTAGVLRPD
ncbi:MAG TPA: hypothetical protein VFR85_21225 [Anaeromyxobacteraceae bacterium]|nr:hypothetical protein [Anaeromyxobacteraceae bacterium]